jgi:Tol biopolymer transport system component
MASPHRCGPFRVIPFPTSCNRVENVVGDRHRLLRAASGKAPYILAPQSIEGIYARRFVANTQARVTAPGGPMSSAPNPAITSTRWEWNPQFSPDGRRVAFQSTRSGDWEIWLADPDGVNAVQLTSMGAPLTGTARWSHDGQTIAFHSNPEGHLDIYSIPASGGTPRRLTANPANNQVPSFSRDGRWIHFSSNRTGEYRIWKMPVSGGDAVQVSPNTGYVAFESSDGAYRYYTETASEPSALWRLSTSGG